MCNTFAGSGPTDTVPACKEADQMSTTPFPASARHNEATFPSLPWSSVAGDWALASRIQARVTLGVPNLGPLKTFHVKVSISPSSVCQAEAEDESQQRKEETQNGYLEDLTASTDMEVPSEDKKKKR